MLTCQLWVVKSLLWWPVKQLTTACHFMRQTCSSTVGLSWLRCSQTSATICAHCQIANSAVQLVLIHFSLTHNCQVFKDSLQTSSVGTTLVQARLSGQLCCQDSKYNQNKTICTRTTELSVVTAKTGCCVMWFCQWYILHNSSNAVTLHYSILWIL